MPRHHVRVFQAGELTQGGQQIAAFELFGADLLAAAIDVILDAACEDVIGDAFGIDCTHEITGPEKTIRGERASLAAGSW
jgi:hypothetical protein